MNARAKYSVGLSLVAFASLWMVLTARNLTTKPNWTLRMNETRGPVRAADMSPLAETAVSEILAGPANGSDAGYLILTRMPPGTHGPALFSLPDDHLYLVLDGKMNIQIGTDQFVVEKDQGVMIPPGIPHEVWNADTDPEMHFEVVAPGSSRDLMSMVKPAQPRKVENAAQYIRKPKVPARTELKPGLNGAMFAERQTGSNEQMRIDSTLPGQGGPPPHIHKFEQVYFSIDGSTTLMHGLLKYPLPKYSVAIITAGTVHTNNNNSQAIERHITLLLPEPKDRSEPFDIEVELKGGVRGRS